MNKAEACRTNGGKSQGPVTDAGKEKSAQNARTHGLTGGTIVLAHESQADYDALLDSFTTRFRPSDEAERDLIREAVNARWRLRRIEAMEAALFQKAFDEQLELVGDPSLAQALAYADMAENSKGLRLLHRYAKELRRTYEKAMIEFADLHMEENQPEEEDDIDVDIEIYRAISSLAAPPIVGSFRKAAEIAATTEPLELAA